MSAPLVTVSMSAFNAAAFLPEAIESVLAQTFGDFEFLIVNDGSTDGSGDVIDSYARKDSRIAALHQENIGLVRSLNRMTDVAKGRWLARIDADDACLPDRLEKQIAFLTANPEVGIVGSNAYIVDTSGKELARPDVSRPLVHEEIVANFKEGVNLHHPTIMVETDLLRKAGGYRAPFRFAQDYDLYLRLLPHTRMANLPDPLIRYRVHSEQASTKHLFEQTLSAVVAWYSHEARLAGRPDPMDERDTLPEVGTLDAVFGTSGADEYARRRIMQRIIYSPDILAGEGFGVLVDHVRESGASSDLWRIVPRLARAGHYAKAARIGAALMAA